MTRSRHILSTCVALLHLSNAAPTAVPFTVIEPRDQLDRYDYIIVGGGTAGSVLASRLSEDKTSTLSMMYLRLGNITNSTIASILLIEAGGLDQAEDYITIPILAGKAQKTKYDWDYQTVPQKELNNYVMSIPAGKLIGGGSALNGMMLDRGAADNYNAWEELGNKGWGWKGLLPYFKKVRWSFQGTIMETDRETVRPLERDFYPSTRRYRGGVQHHMGLECPRKDGPNPVQLPSTPRAGFEAVL